MTWNFRIRVQAIYANLKNAERRAADYMLANPERVAEDTVGQSAAAAGCSASTFVRIAKKLGFAGYPQMRAAVAAQDEKSPPSGVMSPMDDEAENARAMLRASVQVLVDTLNLFDEGEYRRAMAFLVAARRYLFLGVGDAYAAAYTIYLKFLRAGLDTRCPQDFDVQLIEASLLSPGDAVMLVSHSGQSRSVTEALRVARGAGAKIITVTDYPASPIAKQSDVVLRTAAFLSDAAGEVISKRLPAMCLLESLFANLVLRKGGQDALEKTERTLGINKIP